jgi:hypothetical protein
VTWLNPWALLGLIGVVAPVLIHLLARGHARTRRFPSLRFIEPSQLLPTRRTRIQDPLLLAIRCAIVALAVLALARPLLLARGRKMEIERGVARAIVLDTSASMRRLTPSGNSALDSARRVARTLAGDATASIVIETAQPARQLEGAVAWLRQHYQRAELTVISDFQRGQIDSSDVQAVPGDVSVTLRRVPVVSPSVMETPWASGGRRVTVRATPRAQSMDAEWTVSSESVADSSVALVGPESDRAAINATRIAAGFEAVPLPRDSGRSVRIEARVLGDSATRRLRTRRLGDSATRRLGDSARYAPWMVGLLARLHARGDPIPRSAVAGSGERRQLVLFMDSAAGSAAAARIVAEANRAISIAPRVAELEPETLSEREIEGLQQLPRAGGRARSADPNGQSDARWLWLAALVLLLIEIPLRRHARRSEMSSVVSERARAA